jgi:hypothetical protein
MLILRTGDLLFKGNVNQGFYSVMKTTDKSLVAEFAEFYDKSERSGVCFINSVNIL